MRFLDEKLQTWTVLGKRKGEHTQCLGDHQQSQAFYLMLGMQASLW